MAAEVPSGRVGEPEHPDEYVPVLVGEYGRRHGTVYVPKGIWARLRPATRELTFYMPDGGRIRLDFDAPVRRLKP